VHRNNILIYIQQDATLHSLFICGNCSTYFWWYFHLSSGVHTTVSTASGICHTVTAICRCRGRVGIGSNVSTKATVWQIPDAVDRVVCVCAPDDGWKYHPKKVEHFPDKINCLTLHLVGYVVVYINLISLYDQFANCLRLIKESMFIVSMVILY
jgi:hypothetical protein